jgi:hypothetical protein
MKGIPPGNSNSEKPRLLKYFIEGVCKSGDDGKVIDNFHHYPSDVAILQGFVHPQSKHVPHLDLRRQVLENQKNKNKRTIIADANLFLYADPSNTRTYLRYSYDGVFCDSGEYCWDHPDPRRWQQIQKDLGLKLQPNRKDGNHILICCQRDGGWSMEGKHVVPWLHPMILRIKRVTDRPIRIRLHPGDKKAKDHALKISRLGHNNVTISERTRPLMADFAGAHCVVNHNSSPTVAAAIEGIPTFVTDPMKAQAGPVSHTDLNEIENPRHFDRETWIQRIAMCHWRLDELKSGACWQHMKNWAILK